MKSATCRLVGCFHSALLLACTFLLAPCAGAQETAPKKAVELIPGVTITPDGALHIEEEDVLSIAHANPNWVFSHQGAKTVKVPDGALRSSAQEWSLQGTLTVRGGLFQLRETIAKVDAHTLHYLAEIVSDTPVPGKDLFLNLSLPSSRAAGLQVRIDDKTITLPAEFDPAQSIFLFGGNAKRVTIPLRRGVLELEGDFRLHLQDDRIWVNSFSFRFGFDLDMRGSIKNGRFAAVIRYKPYRSTPLALAGVANMGFADEKANDKTGGWTDQGPKNDLRNIRPGRHNYGGVFFRILDPKANQGKSCLVLAGPEREYFPKEAVIPGGGKVYKALYLLHAIAWAKEGLIGTLRIQYADGTETIREVLCPRDVANWWAPVPLEKGALAWTAENAESYIGLYESRFPVAEKPIKTVKIESTGQSVWMIVAVSGGIDDIPLPRENPVYIVEGPEWRKVKEQKSIQAGSVLDFSFLQDAPAGKHGRVLARDGHFEFEKRPGIPQRFYGTNLIFGYAFPTHEKADSLADRLARVGYNAVRFHHYDALLIDKDAHFSANRQSTPSHTLNPEMLERIDYLFAALKKRGLYISIDLHTIRQLRPEDVPEAPVIEEGKTIPYWQLVLLFRSAREAHKRFVMNLLGHVNPYTGQSWATDPALFSISLGNENNVHKRYRLIPEIGKLYEARLKEWLQKRNLAPKTPAETEILMARMIAELHIEVYREMAAYMREELHLQALLTDLCWKNQVCLSHERALLDYTDLHSYWDHPRFPVKNWTYPMGYRNQSVLKYFAESPLFNAPARIIGKPHMMTEFDFWGPRFNAEAGPVGGAYAALQGWSGVFQFSHNPNPLRLLSEKAGLLFFLRGDVATAKSCVPFVLNEDTLRRAAPPAWWTEDYPANIWKLGLYTRLGTVVADAKTPLPPGAIATFGLEKAPGEPLAGVPFLRADERLIPELIERSIIPAAAFNYGRGTVISETGEIHLDTQAQTFRVVTKKSEALILHEGKEMRGDVLSVSNGGNNAVFFAGALDKRPLRESKHILVLHLTDITRHKVRFRDRAMTLMDKRGGHWIIRRGTAKIRLQGNGWAGAQVFAISTDGARMSEVAVWITENQLAFTAEVFHQDGVCLAYEIVRE